MNLEQYEECKKNVPYFDKKWTKRVSVKDIVFDEHTSQIRKKGHVVEKVPKMAQQIMSNGQKVPCTVRSLPDGKWELKEGCTRVLAHKEIGEHSLVLISTWHDSQLSTQDEWYDFQCQANDHIVHTPNSDEDIVNQISTRVLNGRLDAVNGYKYQSNPEKWVEDSVSHLMSIYKNSAWNKAKFKRTVEKCLRGTVALMFSNYTKETAMEFINNFNSLSWSTNHTKKKSAIGDIENQICFYVCANPRQLTKDAFSNAAYKAIGNQNVDIHLVAWVGDLSGKDEKGVDSVRQKYKDEYDKINNHYNIFSGLWFLPQIKNGPKKELSNQLIKIK